MANHLKNEDSPYLQQHADNPVMWYPWSEEAFLKAKKEHKSIFLSIGYSSCHWCHVMERESFQNQTTADILNKHFIAIKVDKEERPDIDKHFQEVYQLMKQRAGGWPLSLFLTAELKPFYSATYIPPEPRYGMMSFDSLLEVIADKYHNEKALLTEKADEILTFLNPKKSKIQATKLDNSIVMRITNHTTELFDSTYGGFNKAPKFPQASTLNLILDAYQLNQEKTLLNAVLFTLSSMAKGGLYDLVDGGFCRYSTDNQWRIPHFEKMTYDNALLSAVYLRAYTITTNPFYKNIAFNTLDFMITKMSHNHLFFSASDADSNAKEGDYFTYAYEEVIEGFTKAKIPKKEQKNILTLLHITEDGNFEDKNIIHINDVTDTQTPYYQEAISLLKQIRAKRDYPFIDKKIILSWNAMMITALFKASKVDKKYLCIAISSLDTLLSTLYINSELFHSTLIDKKPKIKAFLEDYAYLSQALIEAYQATLNEIYLITATKLINSAIEKYFDKGEWKFSRGEFETKATIYDNAYPSSVATLLDALYSLSSLVDSVYKKFVFKTLERYSYDTMRQPLSTPSMSHIILRYLYDDIIIKASQEKLKPYIKEREKLAYPFLFFKNDTNQGYMICNSNSCFGHEKTFQQVIEFIEQRDKK